ncbi:MAG: Glutamate--tRNA ligase mitochondrial [Thelocarpon impressellum]|nr:MAG: Glutamate--tRNA ligase mitochondrial [Thelocarpon impressellum]
MVPIEYPDFADLVYGRVGKNRHGGIMFKHGEAAYEDPVLLKSDGLPTYHLANVVDDHLMRITHVIRAAEWISSTPKHLALYGAFGWEPPKFAHVGLLQDSSGHKLSKRSFDLDISSFRNGLAVFPEALVNYVALLGWSHQQGRDVMTMKQLIDNFDLKFTKGNTIVAFEKLWFLQKAHAQRYADEGGREFEELVDRVAKTTQAQVDPKDLEYVLRGRDVRPYTASILKADAKSFTTTQDFLTRNSYFLGPICRSAYSSPTPLVTTEQLTHAASWLQAIPVGEWTLETIKQKMSDILAAVPVALKNQDEPTKASKAWHKALHHYLRWALADGRRGPGVADTLAILGRDVVLERLGDAAEDCAGGDEA